MKTPIVEQCKNMLIVSCQAANGLPFSDDFVIEKMIDSVVLAGVRGVRVNGPLAIKYAKERGLFVIGILRVYENDLKKITPNVISAEVCINAGADVVAIEATGSLHTEESLRELVVGIRKIKNDICIMADIGTQSEADRAVHCGVDMVATTFLDTYMADAYVWEEHVSFIKIMLEKLHIPIICEGGVTEPWQVSEVITTGAHAVVVGKAITDPISLSKKFLHYAR
jgi:N-acylglucosamine-6-phosphate 2-epimerase